MKSLAPNTLLQNRYLVVHLIGKGGMGDVYLAVDQRLGSAVALKRTFFADDELLGNAFEREAKTLARLRHPVLPKVSDHFSEGGEQYLVMEHISGEDLSKRLEAAQKPFPFSWVLFWADQMLDALAYLHTHEPPIIHRDIKPQNLKLTDENHIILLDFGLSKNSGGETKAVTSGGSSTGSIVGYTPHYAPMEQIRGTGTNPRSDLYSLSATLYQLMTNIVPADALTRADSLLNGSPDPIKPIYELNPEVSKQVSDVILKGMEVSQERRFSAAREMQKILRDAYAQMQNMMAAQTMAFNLQEVEAALPVDNSVRQTGRLEASPENGSAAAGNQPPNLSGAYQAEQTSGGGNAPQIQSFDPNFDQTLRMDTPPALRQENAAPVELPKQSDVKTEVFLAGEIAAATAPPVNSFASENKAENKPLESESNFNPTENFALTGDYNLNRNDEGEENFAAGSTVPLFTADDSNNQPADSGFYNNQSAAGGAAGNYEDFSATGNFSGGELAASQTKEFVVKPETVSPKPVPVKKKSGAKILGVIAGLGALLLLAGGAIGGGWWYYSKNYAAALPTPATTPLPTATATPTFTPTPEDTPDTNVNGAIANNSNVGGTTDTNTANDNANVRIKPTPNVESTPTSTPKPIPTVKAPVDKPVVVPKPPKTPKPPKNSPPIPEQ